MGLVPALNHPTSGTANPVTLTDNDDAIRTVVNGQIDADNLASNAVTTAKITDDAVTAAKIADGVVSDTLLASPNNSVYRTILNAQQVLLADHPTGSTTFLTNSWTGQYGSANDSTQPWALSSSQAIWTTTSSYQALPTSPFGVYIVAADYAVAGKTTKIRIRAQALVNPTSPSSDFVVGLYPVTLSGGSDTLILTPGTVVSSSQATISSPSTNAVTSAVSSDISLPSDGLYALAWTSTGALANNSVVMLMAQLQMRHV